MVTWAGNGVSNIPVSRNDVRAQRERSRICLVLVLPLDGALMVSPTLTETVMSKERRAKMR